MAKSSIDILIEQLSKFYTSPVINLFLHNFRSADEKKAFMVALGNNPFVKHVICRNGQFSEEELKEIDHITNNTNEKGLTQSLLAQFHMHPLFSVKDLVEIVGDYAGSCCEHKGHKPRCDLSE